MVVERFYFSAGGHIKIIFFTKTLDKSIKIEGFALKMMTFFKEAFQVNRKSYPERVRSALFHAIALLPSIDKGRHTGRRVCPCQSMVLFILYKIDSAYFVQNVEKAHLPLKHLERYGIICVLINLCVRTAFKWILTVHAKNQTAHIEMDWRSG